MKGRFIVKTNSAEQYTSEQVSDLDTAILRAREVGFEIAGDREVYINIRFPYAEELARDDSLFLVYKLVSKLGKLQEEIVYICRA